MRGTDHSFGATVNMCLVACDLETSTVRRPRQAFVLFATSKRKIYWKGKTVNAVVGRGHIISVKEKKLCSVNR